MAGAQFPRPIILVGLMGSGKTTIGRALAERLGFRFIDNDAGIEAEYDASGRQLAETLGLSALHRIEAAQLENALTSFGLEAAVIAAAASVVDDEASRALLLPQTVVWLHADPAYLLDRVGGGAHRRSLGLEPHQQLRSQADRRQYHFEAVSDWMVSVEGRAVGDVVEEICRRLGPPD